MNDLFMIICIIISLDIGENVKVLGVGVGLDMYNKKTKSSSY